MSNNLILITGADGQLAKTFSEIYSKNKLILFNKKNLDILDKNKVLALVSKYKPKIILHFASMTRGDECAKDPDKAYQINVIGTRNIINACKVNDCELVFVSTNEVFDGNNKNPYTEKDKPNPITIVGKTKYEAEKLIQKNLKRYYIIRTSWLFSKWSSNFIHMILLKVKTSKSLELVDDEISSPTYSLDLAKAIKKLIRIKKYGLYHVVNEGSVSRLNFAKEALKIQGIDDINIIPVGLDSYKRLSKPPKYSPLKSLKLKKIGIKMSKWENSLKRFLISENV